MLLHTVALNSDLECIVINMYRAFSMLVLDWNAKCSVCEVQFHVIVITISWLSVTLVHLSG
uniref:Uncharacterized protein n=1 Tax=Kalanchoe fedtschenkoi TaxID=63787 RepID=A0A7N1A2A8_KALFE